MKSLLAGFFLLSVLTVVLSIAPRPPPFYSSPSDPQLAKSSGRFRRSNEGAQEAPGLQKFSEFDSLAERVRRSPQTPQVYRPGQDKPPRPVHPTYKVPQTTQRSYPF